MATLYACQRFVTAEQVFTFGCDCLVHEEDPGVTEIVEAAADAASDILAILTGFRVLGKCARTVRPIGGSACYPVNDLSWAGADRFGGLATIDLGPEATVVKITIDGVDLEPTEYSILDGQYLLRREGSWPTYNDLRLTAGQVGTWTIQLTNGHDADFLTVAAALELTCELTATRLGKKSRLPPGTTSVNIQGAAVQVERAAQKEMLQATQRFLTVYAPNGPNVVAVWSPELEQGWNLVTVS